MNHALLLTKNCLSLTQNCIESLRAQDIPVKIHVYDNLSGDGTPEWIEQQSDIIDHSSGVDLGVSGGWNFVLDSLFSTSDPAHGWHADHVLVVNNDTYLPPWFYQTLLSYEWEIPDEYIGEDVQARLVEFVTGVSVGSMEEIAAQPPRKGLVESPDFSAFLIRKSAWEKIGPFNENLVHYCGDMDYHIRAHCLGVNLWNCGLPFYHERSATMRLANSKERRIIELQADADRETFRSIYGVGANDPAYADLFK